MPTQRQDMGPQHTAVPPAAVTAIGNKIEAWTEPSWHTTFEKASMNEHEDRFRLDRVAFFGRTLAEYLQMFAIGIDDLRGARILDVASGPGSFVAEALALGLDATGCDPLYSQAAAEIVARGRADIDACRQQLRRKPGVLVYRDIDRFYSDKDAALAAFAADFRRRQGACRYVAGALPSLPFPDASFDVVLSANFLLIYAPLADGGMHDGDDFGLDFHLRAFRDLARVTRRELRVTGMHTWTQPPTPHPYRQPVVQALEQAGFAVTLVSSDYDDGCLAGGAHLPQVLVARRGPNGHHASRPSPASSKAVDSAGSSCET